MVELSGRPAVSVIMPFVNEWPQVAFTIRSVHEALQGIDHEIIAVDNYCNEVRSQGYKMDRGHREPDKAHGHVEMAAGKLPWLKYVQFEDKLSCWGSRNAGVRSSRGDLLLFLDSHVIPSDGLLQMAVQHCLSPEWQSVHPYDTLHLPLSYQILDSRRLIYRFVWEPHKGNCHYAFVSAPGDLEEVLEVPCMSSCGMIMPRRLYDRLGGWPEALSAWGGGENFFNFSMAVMGHRKYVFPYGTLHHHGDKRNYNYSHDGFHRNRMIANACFGGEPWVDAYAAHMSGNRGIIQRLKEEALQGAEPQRSAIQKHRVRSIEDFAEQWHEKARRY